ncbi:MAG: hypothetical protein HUU38_09600 [Anaerolineales bacterium]|nr:hypothetical protein [Anaerolineales bacterium]
MNDLKHLAEDLASETQAADLLPTVERLQTWRTPTPTPADTARLLATLTPSLPSHSFSPLPLISSSLLLLRSQLYIVRREIWAASALVIMLGAGISILIPTGGTLPDGTPTPDGFALALVAPLVAAMGISFLYGPGVDPAVEIEEATPVTQRQILLARLTLVFGFNLALGLLASLSVIVAGFLGLTAPISLPALIGLWLAPMTSLSALALFLTVLTGDSLAGVVASLGLWMVQAFRAFAPSEPIIFFLPNLLAPEIRPWLWTLALCLGVLAFWLAGREGQMLGRRA